MKFHTRSALAPPEAPATIGQIDCVPTKVSGCASGGLVSVIIRTEVNGQSVVPARGAAIGGPNGCPIAG